MKLRLGVAGERPVVGIDDVATPGGRCPACGEPLFPWIEVDGDAEGAKLSHVVDRCENCHLAIERGDGGEGLANLIEDLSRRVARDGEAELVVPNGASWQFSIGTESWAGLHLPEVPEIINPKALALLLEHEGLEAARTSYPAGAGMAQLMQTLLNLITFNRDFARRVLHREITPVTSRQGGIGYGIDALATVLIAIPVAALSVLIEGAAIAARHGGVLRTTVRRSRRPRG